MTIRHSQHRNHALLAVREAIRPVLKFLVVGTKMSLWLSSFRYFNKHEVGHNRTILKPLKGNWKSLDIALEEHRNCP